MNKKKHCGECGEQFVPDEKFYSICQNCKENDVLRYGDQIQSKKLAAMSFLLTELNHFEEQELSQSGAMKELITTMFKNMPAKDVLTLAEKAMK